MKVEGIVRWSILLTLALTLLPASSAFGCIPEDDLIPVRCVRLPKATPEQRPAVVAAASKPQSGGSPAAGLKASSTPQPAGSPASAPALALLAPSSAFGCVPDDDANPVRCVRLPKPTPEQPAALVATPTKAPPGNNPAAAQEPTGNWLFIGPNATHWYKIKDAGLQLTIWLDANGQGGLSLAVYAPDQQDLYGKPTGRGTFNKFEPHDLFWTGRTRARGTWYAVVTNSNGHAVSYNLNYARSRHTTADRCSACHGNDIEWERCESAPGSSWCEDLQEEYNK